METLDCRNLPCPAPVVAVRQALATLDGAVLEVLVDSGAPLENVTRFAVARGYHVVESPLANGHSLIVQATAGTEPKVEVTAGRTILVTSDCLGNGPEELGALLMKNLIFTFLETDDTPDRMFFVNSGVLLACQGSEVSQALHELASRGVEILSCGLCLDYFQKKEQLQVGTITNMFTIAESLLGATSIVML